MNNIFCGIEKLSLVDYDDKVACTLFTNGCNFRCPFCHNGSLVLKRQEGIDFNTILDYLKKRKGVIDAVVITGGEPTLIPSLVDAIYEIKKIGILVKLDTNGSNPKLLKQLIDLKLVDYVAMDIKNSEQKYAETIGLENVEIAKIKESINIIKSSGIDYEFRTTLIAEFHTLDDLINIKAMIKDAKKYVLQHFIERDECINHGLHEISKSECMTFYEALNDEKFKVIIRGYK